jgi:diacylglycerol kinase
MTYPEQQKQNNLNSWPLTFKHACDGCVYAFKTQRNFKVHLMFSVIAVVLAFWLGVSFFRFAVLVFAIVFGFTMEMVNTAFEKTVDLVTERYNPKAKVAKDIAAGAVLVASVGLFILGALALLPPLWQRIFSL